MIDGDLVWIDTHDDPILTHAIAEQVIGPAIDRGRWLIMGYAASVQDGTARLGIVDREMGGERLSHPTSSTFMSPDISTATTTCTRPIEPPAIRSGSSTRCAVAILRSHDGLWVATINQSDIP